ncbi:hypothetical protein T472_0210120 [Youngiibacter fragilis 232.1]|uniref:Uncharacterized protein n=1 Tax=Youngiibacter fragilis 232.1 TaxID=994573 RepID=V7I4E6_9CLOT|nr:hypothetical protein T472_0210120 [Youngiibacter fragilis 232.1]
MHAIENIIAEESFKNLKISETAVLMRILKSGNMR